MIDVGTAPKTLPPPPAAGLPIENAEVEQRAFGLGFDFMRAILADPDILDDVPDGSVVALIPADDPELAEREIAQGIAWLRAGADVYFRHVRPTDTRAATAEADETAS